MRTRRYLIGLWGLILFYGCQPTPVENGTQPAETSSPVAVSTSAGNISMTPSQPTSTDSSLQNLIRRAQEDLASRLALPADEVSVVEITAVEWSDSSLDCPQPGMSYMQVITPGYRIIFEVNGQPYEYHSNGDSNFVYCNNSSLPAIPKP